MGKYGEGIEYEVPIPKAGKGQTVKIHSGDLNDEIVRQAMAEGLKVLLNRKMTKVTKAEMPNDAERQEAALEIAKQNAQDLLDGKIKARASAAKAPAGVSGKVAKRALDNARQAIKDQIRRDGGKISLIKPSKITEAARKLLEARPHMLQKAADELAAIEAMGKEATIDVSDIPTDEGLVKAELKKKATAKAKAPPKKKGERPQVHA